MKLSPGDRVAVLSLSFAAPAVFPAVHEQGLRRLRDELGLEPVEFPTTRRHGASPADRAADLMAAYADPSIRAVLATIGGNDQITVLPYLDPEVFRADPKPFLGFSDNTNLLNWLSFHGIPAFHGGSTMVHLARGAGIDPEHLTSLRAALFEKTELEIRPLAAFCEEEMGWEDPDALTKSPPSVPSPGWFWHQPDRVVTGPSWGGCLEILYGNLAVGRWIHPVERYAGSVLLLETSEMMPSGDEVFRMLRDVGERGLLRQFPAVLMATAKGTVFFDPHPPAERDAYREEQRAAVLRAMAIYNPEAMIVFGVDFGHTSPQWVLPYGGRITVDGPARRITAHY